MKENSSNMLEHPHAIQVLLFLRNKFPMALLDLQEAIKVNRSALERRIEELSFAGLIKVEVIRKMQRRVIVSLTPLGRDVANRLAEIERLNKQFGLG